MRNYHQSATQPISDFLSNAAIKKHNLEGYKVNYSIISGDDKTLSIVDKDGEPTLLYLKKQGKGYTVKSL